MTRRELAESIFALLPTLNHRFFRNLPKSVFTRQQIRLLHILSRHGNQPMKTFSDKMHMSKPNLTKLVDHLIEEGYVQRMRDENDRRKVLLNLTEKGDGVLKDHYKVMIEEVALKFDILSDEEVDEMAAHFDAIRKLMDRVEQGGI